MGEKEAFLCPFCGAPYSELVPAGTVQVKVKCRYCGATILVPPFFIRQGGAVQRCRKHPDNLAVGFCKNCQKTFCDKCLRVWRALYLCHKCLEIQISNEVIGLFFVAFGMLIVGIMAANLLALYPRANTSGIWALTTFFFFLFLVIAVL